MSTLFYLEKLFSGQDRVIFYDVLDYRKSSGCVHVYIWACTKKNASQERAWTTSFLLILSPSIPETTKNEATKGWMFGEWGEKGKSPLSNETLTQVHTLECGQYVWSRKHGSKTADRGQEQTAIWPRTRAGEAPTWVQVSAPTRLSSCTIPGTPCCQWPHYLSLMGSSRLWHAWTPQHEAFQTVIVNK